MDEVTTREDAIRRIEQITAPFTAFEGPFGRYRDPEKPETVYNDIGSDDGGAQ